VAGPGGPAGPAEGEAGGQTTRAETAGRLSAEDVAALEKLVVEEDADLDV
jgi:hypothetical protein